GWLSSSASLQSLLFRRLTKSARRRAAMGLTWLCVDQRRLSIAGQIGLGSYGAGRLNQSVGFAPQQLKDSAAFPIGRRRLELGVDGRFGLCQKPPRLVFLALLPFGHRQHHFWIKNGACARRFSVESRDGQLQALPRFFVFAGAVVKCSAGRNIA